MGAVLLHSFCGRVRPHRRSRRNDAARGYNLHFACLSTSRLQAQELATAGHHTHILLLRAHYLHELLRRREPQQHERRLLQCVRPRA